MLNDDSNMEGSPREARPYGLPPGDHPKLPIYAEVVLALALVLGAVLSLSKSTSWIIS
jgi:hypothetical protein